MSAAAAALLQPVADTNGCGRAGKGPEERAMLPPPPRPPAATNRDGGVPLAAAAAAGAGAGAGARAESGGGGGGGGGRAGGARVWRSRRHGRGSRERESPIMPIAGTRGDPRRGLGATVARGGSGSGGGGEAGQGDEPRSGGAHPLAEGAGGGGRRGTPQEPRAGQRGGGGEGGGRLGGGGVVGSGGGGQRQQPQRQRQGGAASAAHAPAGGAGVGRASGRRSDTGRQARVGPSFWAVRLARAARSPTGRRRRGPAIRAGRPRSGCRAVRVSEAAEVFPHYCVT